MRNDGIFPPAMATAEDDDDFRGPQSHVIGRGNGIEAAPTFLIFISREA